MSVGYYALCLQVKAHEDKWDLSRCSPPARAAWWLSRAVWSAQEAGKDLGEDAREAMKRLSPSNDDSQQVLLMSALLLPM